MLESDQAVIIEPREEAQASVIWLHGLGADGHDFVPVIPALGLPEALAVRFIFPHAPLKPVTVNAGGVCRSWYDILAMGPSRHINEADLLHSTARIHGLIEAEELRGIPSSRILVLGFSQGGAVAYHAALSFPRPLGGLAALSTYLINTPSLPVTLSDKNRELPVFIGHGEYDEVVWPALGQKACAELQGRGLAPLWHSYPMGHELCMTQVQDLGAWLQKALS